MEVKFIDHTDELLKKVIQLGKKNSNTLGLMPKDAYTQQARKKSIVVITENSELLGYCLFRATETKNRISITQLCIDQIHRNKGLSKHLLDKIRDKYKHIFNGMLVSCREDYKEAQSLWNSYGFICKKRVRSRSTQEKYLLKLWYSFDPKDLFAIDVNSCNLRVVLDLNIIIKLQDAESGNEEIHQLLSDWLTTEVDYCYAKETLNEIHRDRDFQRTTITIQFLNAFQELTCNPSESQQFLPQLKELHPGESDNHISDRKQLAECKASSIAYFITMDEELISNRDKIYEVLGLNILRPGEFILEIDEIKNRRLYEPIRLQGARYEVKRIASHELLNTINLFLNKEDGERLSEFKKHVLLVTSNTENSTTKVVLSPDGETISFYSFTVSIDSISIEFLRLKKLPIANTLFLQIIIEVIRDALKLKKPIVKLKEKLITDEQKETLLNNGFIHSEGCWIKIALDGISDSASLTLQYPIINSYSEIIKPLNLSQNQLDQEIQQTLKLNVERKLWPLKLSDLSIPVFIVPIKPLWASQLFDYLSSSESIFGVPPELSWSIENVYYRSHQPNVESYPARILWYASQEKGFTRQKSIVGCSYLNNVLIGEAKQLYSTFRRFGVYKWPDILSLAKGDIHRVIKVLQFSHSEVFERTIPFKEVNEVLLNENQKIQTFVSPVKVNSNVFNKIYRIGKRII